MLREGENCSLFFQFTNESGIFDCCRKFEMLQYNVHLTGASSRVFLKAEKLSLLLGHSNVKSVSF